MGVEKQRRPILGTIGATTVQILSQASTATTITNKGVTIINSTGAGRKTFKLAKPARAGVQKRIAFIVNTTGDVAVLAGPTTASVFYGSTFGQVVVSTGATKHRAIELVATSTAVWAIASRSTGVVPTA